MTFLDPTHPPCNQTTSINPTLLRYNVIIWPTQPPTPLDYVIYGQSLIKFCLATAFRNMTIPLYLGFTVCICNEVILFKPKGYLLEDLQYVFKERDLNVCSLHKKYVFKLQNDLSFFKMFSPI